MISEIKNYILHNWDSILPSVNKPDDFIFLKVGNRTCSSLPIAFLVFSHRQYLPFFNLKISGNSEQEDTIKQEYYRLLAIRKLLSTKQLLNSLPEPLFFGELSSGQKVLIETAIHGRPFINGLKNRINQVKKIEEVCSWLVEFGSNTRQGLVKIDAAFAEDYIESSLRTFFNRFNFLDDRLKSAIRNLFDLILSAQKDKSLPLISQHGDFSPYNIFCDNKKI